MEGFLTTDQLAARLGIQRASIYRMHTRGDLPEPEKIGRTPVWPLPVIETWEKDRPGHGWRRGKKLPPGTTVPAADLPGVVDVAEQWYGVTDAGRTLHLVRGPITVGVSAICGQRVVRVASPLDSTNLCRRCDERTEWATRTRR